MYVKDLGIILPFLIRTKGLVLLLILCIDCITLFSSKIDDRFLKDFFTKGRDCQLKEMVRKLSAFLYL